MMHLRFLVVSITLLMIGLSAVSPTAQAWIVISDSAISLRPHWKKNEQFHYQLIKSKVKSENSAAVEKISNHTDIKIDVVEATSNGYVIGWTYDETRFDDPSQDNDPFVRRMASLNKGFRILLEVDQKGAIRSVRNWQDLKQEVSKATNMTIDELKGSGYDQSLLENLRSQVLSQFSTKEQIEQFCVIEAKLFLMILGREYTVSNPFKYESKLSNPFGGDPFPVKGEFTLKNYDQKSEHAVIGWKQYIPPEDARRIMEQVLKSMVQKQGKTMPDGAIKHFEINDDGEFTINTASGWIEELTVTRNTVADGSTQKDTTIFKKKQ